MVSTLDFENTWTKQAMWTEAGLTRCVICYRLFFLDLEFEWEIPCCNACATKAKESVS